MLLSVQDYIWKSVEMQSYSYITIEFIHAEHSVASDEMVIAVSQSGYSVNTMEALKFYK